MVEKKTRQVTGQAPGETLAQLLNQEVEQMLQRELKQTFVTISTLMNKLQTTPWDAWDASMTREEKRLLGEINAFLATCTVYPELFVAHPRGAPPFFEVEYAPVKADPLRRGAITALCALVRYGLLDRVRRCQRCGRWFFAKKSDSKYCSRDCQTKPTDESKLRKREYAKRHYQQEKERERRAKLKVEEKKREQRAKLKVREGAGNETI